MEKGGGAGNFGRGHVFGGSLRDDFPTGFTTFWAQIDQVVRFREDIEVVLDHHHRVAGFDQPVEEID